MRHFPTLTLALSATAMLVALPHGATAQKTFFGSDNGSSELFAASVQRIITTPEFLSKLQVKAEGTVRSYRCVALYYERGDAVAGWIGQPVRFASRQASGCESIASVVPLVEIPRGTNVMTHDGWIQIPKDEATALSQADAGQLFSEDRLGNFDKMGNFSARVARALTEPLSEVRGSGLVLFTMPAGLEGGTSILPILIGGPLIGTL